MTLLFVLFLGVLALSFGILALMSRPSQHEKLVHGRLGQIGLGSATAGSVPASPQGFLKENARARLAGLDELLDRIGIFSQLQTLIEQAGSNTSPGNVLKASAGLAAAGLLLAWFFIPLLPPRFALAAALGAAPILVLRTRRSRRQKAFNEALPDAIDLLSRALRAGHSVGSAIEVVAEEAQDPVAGEFGLVYQQQRFGFPFRDSLLQMSQRVASRDLHFLITAMLVQKETGGNLIEILDRTAYVIRERLRIYGEVRVKTAQGRLTGWILSLLPVVMGVLLNLINPGYAKPLFGDPTGHKMLYAGAAMLVVGFLIIRKIATVEV